LLTAGCRSSESRQLEAEALGLGRHIDALRNAANDDKPALLSALRTAPCQSGQACALRQLCVDAYTHHVEALNASSRARALLAEPDGGTGASIAAAQQLARAELELERGSALASRCASAQGELLRQARAR
jgi:hypothetical protein